MFKLNAYGRDWNLIPIKQTYTYGNGLAISLMQEGGSCFAHLTVNLIDALEGIATLPDDCAFVDVNNAPWAEKFIQENNLGIHLGMYVQSGYVSYPLYKFNLDKLKGNK